jgi:hypothetical protein
MGVHDQAGGGTGGGSVSGRPTAAVTRPLWPLLLAAATEGAWLLFLLWLATR